MRNQPSLRLILEVKGQDDEEQQTRRRYLDEWVRAVNAHSGFGARGWAVVLDPDAIQTVLAEAEREQSWTHASSNAPACRRLAQTPREFAVCQVCGRATARARPDGLLRWACPRCHERTARVDRRRTRAPRPRAA
jgi:hypothetical protein